MNVDECSLIKSGFPSFFFQLIPMTSTLDTFMNRVISVVTGDGRNIVGMMKVRQAMISRYECFLLRYNERRIVVCRKLFMEWSEFYLEKWFFNATGIFRVLINL